jgi:hypothetical protein
LKKYILPVVIFVSGLIIGFGVSLGVLGEYSSDLSKVEAIMSMSDLETISSRIYRTGDYESSLIILNYLINKLKFLEGISDREELIKIFRIDRGFAHGRLYLIYKRRGEEELSQKEYINAMRLLEAEYNIETEDNLRNVIEKIDQSSRNGVG